MCCIASFISMVLLTGQNDWQTFSVESNSGIATRLIGISDSSRVYIRCGNELWEADITAKPPKCRRIELGNVQGECAGAFVTGGSVTLVFQKLLPDAPFVAGETSIVTVDPVRGSPKKLNISDLLEIKDESGQRSKFSKLVTVAKQIVGAKEKTIQLGTIAFRRTLAESEFAIETIDLTKGGLTTTIDWKDRNTLFRTHGQVGTDDLVPLEVAFINDDPVFRFRFVDDEDVVVTSLRNVEHARERRLIGDLATFEFVEFHKRPVLGGWDESGRRVVLLGLDGKEVGHFNGPHTDADVSFAGCDKGFVALASSDGDHKTRVFYRSMP